MSQEVKGGSTGGVGFVGLLQLVFIILKLCGVIDWSWGWVLAPLWMSAILVTLIIALMFWIFNKK